MQTEEYEALAARTDLDNYTEARLRLVDATNARLTHYLMGLSTEAAECLDILKKHVFYGKPMSTSRLTEELGDVLWYVARACDELGVTMSRVMEMNIVKLEERYPQGFTETAAQRGSGIRIEHMTSPEALIEEGIEGAAEHPDISYKPDYTNSSIKPPKGFVPVPTELKVGKKYLNRSGLTVAIVAYHPERKYPYTDTEGVGYLADGRFLVDSTYYPIDLLLETEHD